jgi:hypothetical protein
MAAHTNWASETPALNQTAAFKVEDATSAKVALDDKFPGFGLPRLVGKVPLSAGYSTWCWLQSNKNRDHKGAQ